MKGYIPIDIPTKGYIKAYIHYQLGDKPLISTSHNIGNKLYDLLEHSTNERKADYSNARYKAYVRVYVPYRTFRHRGANLNENNIKNFNLFVESEIKSRVYFLFDLYIEMLPSFEANLPQVRKRLGITLEDWDDDSIKKDYYRYRLRQGLPLLYSKKLKASTPNSYAENHGF